MTKEDTYTISDNDGEHQIRLSPPASAAQRFSIAQLADSNQVYALCAALGACWRGPGRPKAKIGTYKYDFAKYGQAVFDELDARGCTPEHWVDAASAAFLACLGGMIDVEEVEALAGFTENQEESTGA